LRQTNCATCHKPTRRGAALSIPKGSAAHSNCFSCHGVQTTIAGKNIGSCDTCHAPGRPPRTSEWAKAFGMNFSHREHARGKQSCSACHTVKAGAARGRQVSSPQPAMHFASPRAMSCASCHNGKKAFGANDFKNCKRCHEGTTFKF
jgi:c(7)-type cytochrome triheme protein